ncbi:monovalent cation/H+ antiporter complex subunit F [Neomicrococcus aestuarii]|uniref:Cation:proton antiporter n=1 Tax=Neomicrococcus aestuarii TaxID=556325 RepID=A0A1L2ZPJ1_9MICC|nr:monovalent cation/H+ antiporter complex subunit F [Neomicrococcus aestuarii]APF41345.1 cation:proton antiporter [Neomicrococcus aestuarii]
MMTIVVWICGILMSIGTIGAIYRVAKGPSILQRVLATDVLLIIIASALALDMAINKHTNHMAFVLIACIAGFIGSVTVSRYVYHRDGMK